MFHSWTVCILFFSKITLSLSLMLALSNECAVKLTDLWITSLLFDCGPHRAATYVCLKSVWELDLSGSLFGSFKVCFAVLPVPSPRCIAPYPAYKQSTMAAKLFYPRIRWALKSENLWFFLNTLWKEMAINLLLALLNLQLLG